MKAYTGKTLEDLLEQAAAEKQVAVDALQYFVVEEKSGFLGIGASVTAEVYASCDVESFVFNYLDTFFKGLDQEVAIDIKATSHAVDVRCNADNNAILIGKQGASLEGIANVLRQSINAHFRRRFYVSFDINDYKKNRFEKLESMAVAFAQTVVRTKVDIKLDPMPSDERRIMHKALTNVDHIKTESQGSGRHRHLVIKYKE